MNLNYGKVKSWSNSHKDLYVFDRKNWNKALCMMSDFRQCTAPETLKRGTKFNYSKKLTEAEIQYITDKRELEQMFLKNSPSDDEFDD